MNRMLSSLENVAYNLVEFLLFICNVQELMATTEKLDLKQMWVLADMILSLFHCL